MRTHEPQSLLDLAGIGMRALHAMGRVFYVMVGLVIITSAMLTGSMCYGTRCTCVWRNRKLAASQAAVTESPLLTSQVLRLPATPKELPDIGSTFLVPLTSIACSRERSLGIDVIVSPAVWPLRITLSRPTEQVFWKQIALTVDILDNAGLPPLLVCKPATLGHLEGCGGTGETSASGDGQESELAPLASKGASPSKENTSGQARFCIEISGGGLGAQAVVVALGQTGGSYIVQRTGFLDWNLEAHLNEGDPWVAVSTQGQDIGLATKYGAGDGKLTNIDEEYMQFDTKLDTSSPESVLLLMSMLAVMVFRV